MGFFNRYRKQILWAVLFSFLVGSVVLFSFRFTTRSNRTQAQTVLVANGVKIDQETLNRAYDQLVNYYTSLYRIYGMDFSRQLQGTSGAFMRQRLRAQAADGLIHRVIIDQQARKLKISVPKAELEKAFKERYQNYLKSLGVDEEALAKYLSYRGMTLAKFQAQMRDQVASELREKKLHTYVVGPIQPTDEELLAYYNEHKDRYQSEPEKIKIAHILIKDDEKLAQEVFEKAKAPDADLTALAKEYSQDEKTKDKGGVIDWFARGGSGLSSSVEEKAFSLKVGEVALVKDAQGYHIIKLLGHKDAVYKPFEEVKDQVKKAYTSEVDSKRWNEWYKKQRATATVEVKDPILDAFLSYVEGDTEEALRKLLSAKEKGTSADIYLDYYLGRLYEALYLDAGRKRADLEEKEELSPEEKKRLEELKSKEEEYKREAIESYLAFAAVGEADEDLYQRVLNLDPENVQAHLGLAKLYADRGHYLEADREYQRALEANPNLVQAIVGQGDVAMAMGLYTHAIERYTEALKKQTGSFTITVKLAEAYLKDGKPEEAEPLVKEALKKSPSDTHALKLMGDLLMAQGKPAEAISYYQRAVERSPSAELLIALGDAYKASGQIEKARGTYDDVIHRYSYRFEGYEHMGDLYRDRGNNEEALRWYRDALRRAYRNEDKERIAEKIVALAPDDVEIRFKLADYYRKDYKYDAAIQQYQEILKRRPGNVEALEGIGDCYVPKTRYDDALAYYKKALAQAKSPKRKIQILTKIIESEKKRSSAGKLTEEALEALWQRANLYKAQGNTEKAKADLQEIRKADPNFRAQEVISLLRELGVEVQTPAETISLPQTPSQTPSGGQ